MKAFHQQQMYQVPIINQSGSLIKIIPTWFFKRLQDYAIFFIKCVKEYSILFIKCVKEYSIFFIKCVQEYASNKDIHLFLATNSKLRLPDLRKSRSRGEGGRTR